MIIDIAHGNGGAETARLISDCFLPALNHPALAEMTDAAVLPSSARIAFTTDTFVVKPLFFPGGDIGRLAVCGAVNDLLVMGAVPKYLSLAFILETNFNTDSLSPILHSIQAAACEAEVSVVTADTKVIEGNGGLMINASGVGFAESDIYHPSRVTAGDKILVSGFLGEHHACILSRRMGIANHIESDAAPLNDLCQKLREEKIPVHAMRDITRGGLATVLHEIALSAGCSMQIEEERLPVSREVNGLCAMLGLDPLVMGNEGKLAAFIPEAYAARALAVMQSARYGENAAIAGTVIPKGSESHNRVMLQTRYGGKRWVAPLRGEGLPRIC